MKIVASFVRVGSIAFVVMSATLAGCLGGCPPGYTTANWQQEGLYEAMRGAGATDSTPSGLAFTFPPRPDAVLTTVGREVDWPTKHRHFLDSFHLTGDGILSVDTAYEVPLEAVRSGFASFLANVTAAPTPQVHEWAEAALASRDVQQLRYGDGPDEYIMSYMYRVAVAGPFRLEALFNESEASVVESRQTTGQLETLQSGIWRFDFAVPTRNMVLPGGIGLEVDSMGRATADLAEIHAPEAEITQEEALERLKSAMREAGLPDQGPTLESVWGYMC